MHNQIVLSCEFVKAIPDKLDEKTLYVSMDYATAAHKCCCGCGKEVITPFSPTDWKLKFDGVSVSLTPSIGNWSFPCRSHYWIERNRVKWAEQWSDEQIAAGRGRDRQAKKRYYNPAPPEDNGDTAPGTHKWSQDKPRTDLWSRLLRLWRRSR